MKVVFLHGIGDGDPEYTWLDGLNRGLTQAGHDPIDREHVIAPRYSSYLKTEGRSGKLPPITYKPQDEASARQEFERRQARVQRLLRLQHGVRTFGFNLIPPPVWDVTPDFLISHASVMNLDQVRRYVRDDKVRADVMNHIIDHLPSYGDVILVAHSLGSVIAIDLLDHLPENFHVRRFITIGSPANIRALHEGSERLLKKFPYSRVDDWSNFLNVRDIVTGGRGLASTFPGAQDFLLTTIAGHDAATYLGEASVSALIADVLYPSKAVVRASADVAVRMGDGEASMLLCNTSQKPSLTTSKTKRCGLDTVPPCRLFAMTLPRSCRSRRLRVSSSPRRWSSSRTGPYRHYLTAGSFTKLLESWWCLP